MENLEGCPKTVGNDFVLTNCEIKSLKGGPEYVGGRMFLSHCEKLTSLEYAPKQIGEEGMKTSSLHVSFCPNIQSLEGCPKIVSQLTIYDTPKIKSLKGCPEKVLEISLRNLNSLTDLKYFPKSANAIYITECPIKSLKGICNAPKIKINNTDIENLIGIPDNKDIYIDLDLSYNKKLKTLKGSPEKVWNLILHGCDSLTVEGMADAPIIYGKLAAPHGWSYSSLPDNLSYVSLMY
jgi:hypothetical protein